jgi:ATP-dependent DNA helicase RecQ
LSDIHSILKQYWGYEAFRPLQEDIIRSVLEGRDTLALLPTGGGKSICYQVPALAMEGLTLVVSPLIALMQDQVSRLESLNIPAACIHAGVPYREVKRLLDEMLHGSCKLLYVSPERLRSALFRDYLPELPVSILAIDEAHCISQWGHDFRPDYLKIAAIRPLFPDVPVLALTASATPAVQEDIARQLQMRQPMVFRQSFLRTNLHYSIGYTENKPAVVAQILRQHPGCSLVYCRSRKQTELLAAQLSREGLPATAYHAGMKREQRAEAQAAWMDDRVPVIVATTAFGMGIDKPGVRLVLHYDAPEHLEAWYQEAGRAGRDGRPATALTLYHASDIQRLEESTARQFPPVAFLRQVYQSVCEYLQIPIGAEPDRYYDFDTEELCRRFRLPMAPTFHALRLLERDGLWSLSDSLFHPARVQFMVDRHTLDRLYQHHPHLAEVCTGLLRLYGNIFSYPVVIYEGALSRQLQLSPGEIKMALQRLHALGVANYEPAKDGPQLYFHHLRVAAEHLQIDTERINRLRRQHEARTQAMIRFLEQQETCRNRVLLAYFGEKGTQDCGHCDVCDRRKQHRTPETGLREQVLKILSENQDINLQLLTSQFPEALRTEVVSLVRVLADEGLLAWRDTGSLSLIRPGNP